MHRVTINNCNGGKYLTRWMLWLPNPFFNIYLHKFWAGDDRSYGPHDHPWSFLSIILRGFYIERIYGPDGEYKADLRGWLSTRFRSAETLHAVVLPPGRTAWSLVVTFRRRRPWGFYTPWGWRPHDLAMRDS